MVIRASEPLKILTTSGEVIDAVGGTAAAARLATTALPSGKTCSLQSVTNWRANGSLPPYTFLVYSAELKKLGYQAASTLWGIAPALEDSTASR
jgi:hypothetical protein